MKKFLALTVGALAVSAAALAADDVKVSKTYDLAGFDRIDISGVYELDVKVGPAFSVTLSGRQDDLDHADVTVQSGALQLAHIKHKRGDDRHRNGKGVTATITMPALTGLEVSGVVDGEIAGVDAQNFTIELSGVGDVGISGKCGTLNADVSGVGDLEAKGFECRAVDIEVSGVGSASVYASEEVSAEVSGMGDIDVYGSPAKVSKNKNMFADVTIH